MASDETIEDILASLARKQNALREHLRAQLSSEISGVIYPGGLGGSGGGISENWTFSVSLNPWRSNDGELKFQTIRLIKEGMSHDELRELMDSLTSYEVIRVSAKFSESCPESDTPQGLLESVLEKNALDEDLRQQSEALKTPFFVDDPFFGRMKLDRSVNWLECRRKSGFFTTYRVCVSRDGDSYDGTKAKEIVTSLEARMPEIRDAIRRALYETYTDCWESAGKLNAAQFLKRIRLQSIVVSESGSSGCWFEDGGLFLGHSIEVRIDENGQIESASLAG